MTLKNFSVDDGSDKLLKNVSEIGSMLFTRGVSGTRVVTGREEKIFQGNHVFKGKPIVLKMMIEKKRFNMIHPIFSVYLTLQYKFIQGWGSHYDNTDAPYITAAAAIGMTQNDINLFIKRLDKVLAQKFKEASQKRQDITQHIEKNRILQPQTLNVKTSTQV